MPALSALPQRASAAGVSPRRAPRILGPPWGRRGHRERAPDRIRDDTAWDAFCDALKRAGHGVLREASPGNGVDRAEGHRYLSRLTRLALEKFVELSGAGERP